jgi:PIN domain nuclease of toxin-antitoxin system
VILLDTHNWVWWIQGDRRLSSDDVSRIDSHLGQAIAISSISCWEVSLLANAGRLSFTMSLDAWIDRALSDPSIKLLDLHRSVLVESTRLPEGFHRDPADRILVAHARELNCQLVTVDERILKYAHVNGVHPSKLAFAN